MSMKPEDTANASTDLQRRIFSSVAHDAKTPLSCIIGSLETLNQMKEKLSPSQHDALIKIALDQAQHLVSLFDSIMDKHQPK